MSDEYSKENLNKILYEVIEPKFQKYCYDWLYDAKPDEKRGLFVMSKIIKYKGQKTFSNKLDKEKEEEDLSLEAAYKRYQKRAQSSSYRDFYGGNVDQKFKYNNILKHKPFEFINYSEVIKKQYHSYITQWAAKETSDQYKEYLIDFVRSFYSTYKSNQPNSTAYRNFYQPYKQSDHYSKHATFEVERNTRTAAVPTLEELRAKMNLDELKKKYDRKEPVIFNDNLKNRQEMERHKRELIDGKKNLLKGIYGNINTSVYTESYKTHPKKYANTTLPDFRTSGIKGRMPEEYILKRQIGSLRIGEDLQSKVREIAFK